MRTTLDLDPVVLVELRRRQIAEGKSLNEIVSELLASALRLTVASPEFSWPTRSMHARIDIDEKAALRDMLDQS